MIKIDINCDLGEGIGNEALLMPYLSSCNIACGGHAGNELIMNTVSELAIKHHVKIGAHPSFPDREHFGRKYMSLSSEALQESLSHQIYALKLILDKKNVRMHHVKPHGALYNSAVTDPSIAISIVDVIKTIDQDLILYAPYESVISEIAKQNGIQVMFEAFADRNYNDDLTLVPRGKENALIQDSNAMLKHVSRMIFHGKVTAINGVEVDLKADTFCVHGDGRNAVENLKYLVTHLKQHNVKIA